MIKCMNAECDNYKQELEASIEICPLCKQATENVVTSLDTRKPMGIIVSLAAILALLLPFMPIRSMALFYVGLCLPVVCIVAACIIRIKSAIVISILSLLAMVGVMFYFDIF